MGGGQDIIKGVYYALILTVRNPEKISCKSGTKQRECPSWVCYIYMPHFAVQPLVYPYAIGLCWHCGGMMNISAWGFGVARFDLQGHSQEPLTVKRATVQGFTLEPDSS